jgi:hypothetical protein
MYVAAICYAVQLCAQFFFGKLSLGLHLTILFAGFPSLLTQLPVPETIYERDVAAAEPPEKKKTLARRLGFRTPTNPTGETWLQTFCRPYSMFVYPTVILPSLWVSIAVMTEVANTAGFALNFGTTSRFHFTTAQVGFCFFSGLIGVMLGEGFAGPLCDLLAKRALRKEEEWQPEKILKLTITGLVTIVVR